MSQLEQETSTSLKDLLIGDEIKAFITGTIIGFAMAYGLLKFYPQLVTPNPGYVELNKD